MSKKILLAIILVGAVLAVYGGYFYPIQIASFGSSPVNTEFGTKKIAAIRWSLASSSATSTSLYNSDQNDRMIQSAFATCDTVGASRTAYTGAGLAALTIKAATTTTENPSLVTNSNNAVNFTAIATSTPWNYASTSTEPALGSYGRVWPTGTYLTFYSNATNTAQCIVGVDYLAL